MDNLGAIAGPLLARALVGLVGTRTASALSIIPGLLAALAIVFAIRHPGQRPRRPARGPPWRRPGPGEGSGPPPSLGAGRRGGRPGAGRPRLPPPCRLANRPLD